MVYLKNANPYSQGLKTQQDIITVHKGQSQLSGAACKTQMTEKKIDYEDEGHDYSWHL